MSMKGKTLLPGHTLLYEGEAVRDPSCHYCEKLYYSLTPTAPGHGRCSCGVCSPHLPNRAQRKKWHREHKDALRAGGRQLESDPLGDA